MKRIFLFTVVIAMMILGCKTTEKAMKNDSKGDYFEVKKGNSFEIHFITNASLGLAWTWQNSAAVSIVDSLGSRYVNDYPVDMIGMSVNQYWAFKGVEKGVDTLHFNYCHGGDISTSARTKTVIVKVK